MSGETMGCYSGPAGTEGIGICHAGEATCLPDRSGFGACLGEVLPQATDNCSTPEDEDCSGSSPPCASAWTSTFEIGVISTNSWDFNLTTDPSGNAIFAGSFHGDRSFGGPTLMATSEADLALVKLDGSGTHVWSKSFPATDEVRVISMATDVSGNIILAGSFTGTINLGGVDLAASADDIFVAKYDAAGNHVFSKRFGNNGGDYGYSVSAAPSGDIVLGTYQGNTTDYGGGPVNGAGFVVARFAPDGAHASDRMFPNLVGVTSLDASSNLYVLAMGPPADLGGGVIGFGQRNLYAAKYDALGNHVFSHGVASATTSDFFELVAPLSNGGLAATGAVNGPVDFGLGPVQGALVVGYGAGGAVSSHGVGAYVFFGALVSGGGELQAGGTMVGAADFGGGTVNPMGGGDAFVARYDDAGALLGLTQFGGTSISEWADVTGLGIDSAGQSVIVAHYEGSNVMLGGQRLPSSSASARRIVVAKLP